jgi:hypothetical protein
VWSITRDFPDAERQAQRVLTLLSRAQPSEERDRLELQARTRLVQISWRVAQDLDTAEQNFSGARQLAQRLGDERALATLLSNHALEISIYGPSGALPFLQEAIRCADDTGDLSLRVGVRAPLAIYWFAGRLREGLEVANEIVALAAEDAHLGEQVFEFTP